MKYFCLGYMDEDKWFAMSESERNATTLRWGNGWVSVTDGPFAETKEQIGGYHLVACRDLDEAIAIALRIPILSVGGTIEVRQVEYASQG